jgi:hypothetical protein
VISRYRFDHTPWPGATGQWRQLDVVIPVGAGFGHNAG